MGSRDILVDKNGNVFEMRTICCPICEGDYAYFLGFRGGEERQHNGFGIESRIVRCFKCSLIYPNPFPFPKDSQSLYGDPEKYFEGHNEKGKIENNRNLIRRICQYLKKSQCSLLDCGSGRGEMLVAAQLEGCSGVGLEFSKAMIDYAKRMHGIKVVSKTIEDYTEFATEKFDAVVLNAVLEHVYNPDSMIAAASKLIKPGGILYIDVPNEPHLFTILISVVNRIIGSKTIYNLSPTWPPFHVFGFNPKSIQILLRKHNFEIFSLEIRANPKVRSTSNLEDRLKAFILTQINRIANLTNTAGNMCIFARRI